MDSNFESLSPENADRNPSIRKSSSDKVNRKYRRHSSPSGSDSSSSDGPKHGRTHSPYFSRDEPAKISDVQLKKKNDEGEFAMESGRGRESHKHSDKRSYRSSHDYYRHDDYDRYRKRGDDGGRNHHRSSGYGREASSGIRSDYTRQKFDHDTSGDYRRNTDRYSREESDGEEHRGKDKDRDYREKDSSRERSRSSRRHSNSYGDDSRPGERHRHKKDGGRDNSENYFKSLDDDQNTHSIEEGTRRQSREGKEGNGGRVRETQTSNMKDLDRQKSETTEKRKHHDRESDRHKGKFSRETDGKDYTSSNNRGNYSRDGQFQDSRTRTSDDYKSSPKKSRLFTEGKDQNNGKEGQSFSESTAVADEKLPLRSKLPQETFDKVITKPAPSSNEAEASNDFSAAKVAAIKAAELVNRNLVGGGVMSTDQKKKLLWGSKKTTAAEETGHRWDVPLFSDRERQEKFNKLMGVKGEVKPELKLENNDTSGLLQAEKQEQLQLDLEKQYTAGLRRRDGRTVGLGL